MKLKLKIKSKKKLLSLLLCAAMICCFVPSDMAEASGPSDDGLCEHHTEHTEECGYSEGVAGSPCTHEHTEDCYILETNCVHSHDETCYPDETAADDNAAASDADNNAEPTECSHVCSEESGCITKKLNCTHVHDETCGYVEAVEGTPCEYDCSICAEEEDLDGVNAASVSESNVASVDGKGYDTFEEAYAEAAKNAGTIVLLKDISKIHQGTNAYFTIDGTVTVDLNGHTISSWSGGFAFYILEGGSLTLKGSGTVDGGGYVYGIIWNCGTLKMEDSVVLQNNDAGSGGCGGAVYNEGEFIMDGGSIQKTSAGSYGGAVFNSGTFIMNNGTISETSTTWYGGAVCNWGGTFTMNGGSISGTSSDSDGGAVYSYGTFEMNSGSISGASAAYNGGGVHLESGSFTMNGGSIEGCEVISSKWDSSIGGGGVSVKSGAQFTMNDGLIWKNKSSDGDGGGGVANAGTFTMTGGQIIMNEATSVGTADLGGGVNNIGIMTMSGGMIAKNNGMGGVYSGASDASFKMTGGAVFENYALALSYEVTEENKKVDVVLHASHQENDDVSVCRASDMTADGYAFTAWKYIGEGWRVARTYDGRDIEGTLVPSSEELQITGTDQIFFRAVFETPETEEKEGVYLRGTLGDDTKDGSSFENAVATFARAWELAKDQLEEGKEAVTIYVCGVVRIAGQETWGEDAAKNIGVMRADGYAGELARVVSGGKLTLQNITIDGNGGTAYTDSLIHVTDGGKLLIQDGTVLQNNLAGCEEKDYDGGAVYIENGTGEMIGGRIQNNTARNNGGGVSVDTGTFTMSGGEIVGNKAEYGGGICAVRGGRVEIKDDALISKNSASNGGGVNLGAYTTAEACYGDKKQTLEMTGGTISSNSASNNGGGIYIQSNSVAEIYKGDIVKNQITGGSSFRYRGAGIYVNGGKYDSFNGESVPNGLLQLYNAEIAYNIANEYGGGIAACPTANVKIYVTDGAVFHDNQLDTKSALDIYIAESKNQDSTSYISDFMLGGGMYQWLWFDSSEGIRAKQSQYQNTAEALWLSGLCDDADVEKAVKLATVHIAENHALRGSGGGIASNGDVIIGTPDPSNEEAEITISKSWKDDNDKYHDRPEKIKLDIQYGEYTLRGIELTKENNWTTTLHNMPNEMLNQQSPVVKVLEYDSGKYSLGEVKTEIQEKTLTINIENEYHPMGDLVVSKTVSGTGADREKAFSFTVTLDDTSINGTYGEMEFENGVATFTLKHGESKAATGLPAGVHYKVEESDHEGYTVSSTGAEGEIKANEESKASFTNNKPSGGTTPIYTSVTVNKVWKLDDGGTAADSVTVALLKNGQQKETVTLSAANGWTHTWKNLSLLDNWMVVELNVPEGFSSSITNIGNSFTITNDDNQPEEPSKPEDPTTPDKPDKPDNPADPDDPHNMVPDDPMIPGNTKHPADQIGEPATGDSAVPALWIALFAASAAGAGTLLLYRKRKHQ